MSRQNLAFAALAAALVATLAGGAASLLAQDAPQDAPKAAPAESPKTVKIRRLLVASGAEKASRTAMDGMLDQFAANPMLPPAFIEKFRARADAKEIVELTIPVHERHLDEATIDAAIAYFESDAGKKFVAKQPLIQQESMTAGAKWGEQLAMECLEEIRKEGEAK